MKIDPTLSPVKRASLMVLSRIQTYSQNNGELEDFSESLKKANLTQEEYDDVATEASRLLGKAFEHFENES